MRRMLGTCKYLAETGALVAGFAMIASISAHSDEGSYSWLSHALLEQSPRVAQVSFSRAKQSKTQRSWTDKLTRGEVESPVTTDPFASKTWIAPPKAPAITAPAAPMAPPFPFRFIGKMLLEGSNQNLFLMRGEQLYTASPGDRLDSVYRVDAIGEMDFEVTYLPLSKRERYSYAELVSTASPSTESRPGSSAPVGVSETVSANGLAQAADTLKSHNTTAASVGITRSDDSGIRALVRAIQGPPGGGGPSAQRTFVEERERADPRFDCHEHCGIDR